MQYTYATLKSAIQDMIEDQGSTFAAFIPNMIKGAEDACIVDLDLEIFNATDTMTLSAGSQLGTLPTDMLRAKTIFYTASSTRTFLEERSYDYCIDYAPSTSAQAAPEFYAPLNTTQIFLAPIPNATYTCTVRGPKRPTSLVTTTTGTWLSQKAGDLLFKRCLIEAEKFAVADERLGMWQTDYAEELARKRMEFRHVRNAEYELPQDAPMAAQGA
jgi:hypothetical protein